MRDALRPAGVLWGLTAACYLAAEGVTAHAFAGYSSVSGYISDLGVPGRSPLAGVMNGGFVVQGVLFALAAGIVARALRHTHGPDRRRAALVGLALAHAVGNVVVAVVHSGAGPLHPVGAGLAIVGGNLAVLTAGLLLRGVPFLRPAGVVLAALGLSSLLVLLLGGRPAGVWERGAVDAITAWELLAAAVLIPAAREGSRNPMGGNGP